MTIPSEHANTRIDLEVYLRALSREATPEERERARAYLAANFPRHARLQRRARWRAFLRRTMANAIERGAEAAIAMLLLLLSSPLMLLASILVKLTSRGPIIHRHSRLGKDGHQFDILNLRTYCEYPGYHLDTTWRHPSTDIWVTPIGKLLRRTHIDRLPQLWNVILGDMSLVGPRPERPEVLPRLEREISGYQERLKVRPGITGLAQILCPPDTDIMSVKYRFNYDLYYVLRRTFWLNARIFAATPFAIWGMSADRLSRWFQLPSEEVCRRVTEEYGRVAEAGGTGKPTRPDADLGIIH